MNAEEGENWSWRRWASAAMLAGVFAVGVTDGLDADDGAGVAREDEVLSFPPDTSTDVDVEEDVALTFTCGRRVPERGEVEELRAEVEVEEDVDVAVATRGGVRFVANQR